MPYFNLFQYDLNDFLHEYLCVTWYMIQNKTTCIYQRNLLDLSVQVPTIAIPRAFPYMYLQSQPLGTFRTRNYHCNLSDFSHICIFIPNFSDLSVRVPVLVMHYKGFLLIVSFKSLLQCHPLKIFFKSQIFKNCQENNKKKRKEKFNS